jgi:hypothetical protein
MTRLHPFAALSLIFALVASVSAGEFSSKFVKSLSAANFKKEVLSTDVRRLGVLGISDGFAY